MQSKRKVLPEPLGPYGGADLPEPKIIGNSYCTPAHLLPSVPFPPYRSLTLPPRNRIWCILALKDDIWGNNFKNFLRKESTDHYCSA